MTDLPLFIVECFVALGTIGLALFTMLLARSTKADVEAQWRPLLIPCELERPEQGIPSKVGWAFLTGDGVFAFDFANVGKGAALDVRGYVSEQTSAKVRVMHDCEDLWSPVVAVEAHAEFHGHGNITEFADDRLHVLVLYTDLGGKGHQTRATYRRTVKLAWVVEAVNPRPPQYMGGIELEARLTVWRAGAPFRAVKRWWLRNPLY